MFVNVIDLIKTDNGRKFISIVWGFGLACMFFRVCKDRKCLIYKAPNKNLVDNNSFKSHDHDHNHDTCYKFKRKQAECIDEVIKEKFKI